MAGFPAKIEAHLGRTVDFNPDTGEVEIAVDAAGVHSIRRWDAPEPQPTTAQLDAVGTAADAAEALLLVQVTRGDKYDSIGDQLDNLYKDIVAGKVDATGEFAKSIKAIKDANPKP